MNMKKFLLILSMAFCVLTSFAPASTEGDVAWIVDPLVKTIRVEEKVSIKVTAYGIYGKFTDIHLNYTVETEGQFGLSNFKISESGNDYIFSLDAIGFETGTFVIKLNLYGSYNHNGVKTFNQSKTVVITVIDSSI